MMLFCFEVYSLAVLNLKLLSFILFQVVLSHTFHDWKVCKRSRHRSRQSNEALFVSTRHHSVASSLSLLSLRSKFGNGVTRSPRINSNKPFHRSNIPRSIFSFLANNNYDSQQCRIVFKVTPARVFKRETTTQANHCNKVRYLKTASIIGAY